MNIRNVRIVFIHSEQNFNLRAFREYKICVIFPLLMVVFVFLMEYGGGHIATEMMKDRRTRGSVRT